MIKADGIKAFRGKMIYNPPNLKYRKELRGDFVHRKFDEGGYWYDAWSSYDDRYCEVVLDEADVANRLVDELQDIVDKLKDVRLTAENYDEVYGIVTGAEVLLSKAREDLGVIK